MFLHLGTDVVVSLKQVIAILDLRSAGLAEPTRELMASLHQKKRVVDIANGEAKSLVLTDAGAYLSPISSLTLQRRCDFLNTKVITESPL